jgi:hypothetical protein
VIAEPAKFAPTATRWSLNGKMTAATSTGLGLSLTLQAASMLKMTLGLGLAK